MCVIPLKTARLTEGGRYFRCPDCRRTTQHPPILLEYYSIGLGFCSLCGFCILEGGDRLGVVEVDGAGNRRTRLFTKEEYEERERTRRKWPKGEAG